MLILVAIHMKALLRENIMYRVTDRVIFINAGKLTDKTGEVIGYAEGKKSLIVFLDEPIFHYDEVVYAVTITPHYLKSDFSV